MTAFKQYRNKQNPEEIVEATDYLKCTDYKMNYFEKRWVIIGQHSELTNEEFFNNFKEVNYARNK